MDFLLSTEGKIQKAEFEKHRRELTASLRYAYNIQAALLPSEEFMNHVLPQHFVIFKPRDILSGDFYWLSQKKNKTLVAAADCTGHGVPGALMSILGMAFLNEIASNNSFNRANDILNILREKIMKALHQTGDNEEPKDGMDLAFCIIDRDNEIIEYAGANNPLYIIRNNDLLEFKADRMPIGINAIEEKSFTNHKIKYFPGDILYLFSDGFVDQFGGPREKKFKYGPFKNLLLEMHSLSMDEQKDKILETFKNWKGDFEQIDDVLIIGLKP